MDLFCCVMWDLVPWPGIKPGPPCIGGVESWLLDHQRSPRANTYYGDALTALFHSRFFWGHLGMRHMVVGGRGPEWFMSSFPQMRSCWVSWKSGAYVQGKYGWRSGDPRIYFRSYKLLFIFSFCCTVKCISYTYSLFLNFLPHLSHHRALSRVPWKYLMVQQQRICLQYKGPGFNP